MLLSFASYMFGYALGLVSMSSSWSTGFGILRFGKCDTKERQCDTQQCDNVTRKRGNAASCQCCFLSSKQGGEEERRQPWRQLSESCMPDALLGPALSPPSRALPSPTRGLLTSSSASNLSLVTTNPLHSRSHAAASGGGGGGGSERVVTRGTSGMHKQRIRDKIRLRGKKLMSNAVERVRDSSVAVTRVLRPHADNVEWTVSKHLGGHTDGIWDISVCPWDNETQESIIASASADRTARIWAVESGRELVTLQGHKGSVNSVSFHPYERLVCTASGDKSCSVWRLPPDVFADFDRTENVDALTCGDASGPNKRLGRKSLRPVLGLWGHSNAVSSAAWMASCGLIATASWDRSALLFDVASGASKALRTLAGHDGALTYIAAAWCLSPSCLP